MKRNYFKDDTRVTTMDKPGIVTVLILKNIFLSRNKFLLHPARWRTYHHLYEEKTKKSPLGIAFL